MGMTQNTKVDDSWSVETFKAYVIMCLSLLFPFLHLKIFGDLAEEHE